MRDMKKEKGLVGDEHWLNVPHVSIEGDPDATMLPPGVTQPQMEEIIRSWRKVAILKVTKSLESFRVGFMAGSAMQVLDYSIETRDGLFGMRRGPSPATFFIMSGDSSVRLEVVGTVDIDDPRYAELPLY